MWGVPEGGECLKCFRSVPLRSCQQPVAPLPTLNDIALPRHPIGPIVSAFDDYNSPGGGGGQDAAWGGYNPSDHSYRALLGRISDKGTSYLVTAGTDKILRYWDFSSPAKCYTIAGLQPSQPRPSYETPCAGRYL